MDFKRPFCSKQHFHFFLLISPDNVFSPTEVSREKGKDYDNDSLSTNRCHADKPSQSANNSSHTPESIVKPPQKNSTLRDYRIKVEPEYSSAYERHSQGENREISLAFTDRIKQETNTDLPNSSVLESERHCQNIVEEHDNGHNHMNSHSEVYSNKASEDPSSDKVPSSAVESDEMERERAAYLQARYHASLSHPGSDLVHHYQQMRQQRGSVGGHFPLPIQSLRLLSHHGIPTSSSVKSSLSSLTSDNPSQNIASMFLPYPTPSISSAGVQENGGLSRTAIPFYNNNVNQFTKYLSQVCGGAGVGAGDFPPSLSHQELMMRLGQVHPSARDSYFQLNQEHQPIPFLPMFIPPPLEYNQPHINAVSTSSRPVPTEAAMAAAEIEVAAAAAAAAAVTTSPPTGNKIDAILPTNNLPTNKIIQVEAKQQSPTQVVPDSTSRYQIFSPPPPQPPLPPQSSSSLSPPPMRKSASRYDTHNISNQRPLSKLGRPPNNRTLHLSSHRELRRELPRGSDHQDTPVDPYQFPPSDTVDNAHLDDVTKDNLIPHRSGEELQTSQFYKNPPNHSIAYSSSISPHSSKPLSSPLENECQPLNGISKASNIYSRHSSDKKPERKKRSYDISSLIQKDDDNDKNENMGYNKYDKPHHNNNRDDNNINVNATTLLKSSTPLKSVDHPPFANDLNPQSVHQHHHFHHHHFYRQLLMSPNSSSEVPRKLGSAIPKQFETDNGLPSTDESSVTPPPPSQSAFVDPKTLSSHDGDLERREFMRRDPKAGPSQIRHMQHMLNCLEPSKKKRGEINNIACIKDNNL